MNEINREQCQRSLDPIVWGPTSKVISTTNTLKRVHTLSTVISGTPTMRAKQMNGISAIWKAALEQLEAHSVNDIKESMKSQLTTVRGGEQVLEIYAKQFHAAKTPDDLRKCVYRFQKDIATMSATSDFRKTARGQNGPTYIASYWQFKKNAESKLHRNFVVKWTNWTEICSTHLYAAFSKHLKNGHTNPFFLVPEIAVIDFDKHVHQRPNCPQVFLDQETTPQLKQSIIDVMGKNNCPQDTQVMLIEKINGSNLSDFAKTKYPFLSKEQKLELFEKIGMLTMLDMVLGNTDRMIPFQYNSTTEQYQYLKRMANLGNIMIRWDTEEDEWPELYAIDNGVDSLLISDEKHRIAYKQCLFKTLSNNTSAIDSIAGITLKSMAYDIECRAEMPSEKKPEEILLEFKVFLNDLRESEEVRIALQAGLHKMHAILETSISSFWDNEQNLDTKNHLQINHPELLNAISERFEIFNK